MLSKPSLISNLIIVLFPVLSSVSQANAAPMAEPRGASGVEAIGQQEDLFLAPPLAEETDGWVETAESEFNHQQHQGSPNLSPQPATSDWQPITTQPAQLPPPPSTTPTPPSSDWGPPTTHDAAHPLSRPASAPPTQTTTSQWHKLTPPEDSHWRNVRSFPPKPGSHWTRPRKSTAKKRRARLNQADPIKRWEPWGITPISEPPDRLYLEGHKVKPHAKVRLDGAQLETILIDDKIHHRIIGQLVNPTPGYVHNLRVYYRIRQGLQTVDVGQFSMGPAAQLAPGEQIQFAYPVPMAGELEISFVEWKYEDGRQGIAERGVL